MIGRVASLLGVSQALVWAGVVSVGLTAFSGAVLWLRADAVSDFRDEMDAKAARNRIETKEKADDRTKEVQGLDDDSLLDRLLGRVRGLSNTE